MNTPYYYYTVLEIPKSCSLNDVKRAYRKKALQYHPDKCKDPLIAEKFKEINQAFHVLSDVDKRSSYDAFGGIERIGIPTIDQVAEEKFYEGAGIGMLHMLANIGFIAVFGTPFGMSTSGYLFLSHLLTTWYMIPATEEEAKDKVKWAQSLGAFLSPLLLVTSASYCVGYIMFTGGKLALEYSKSTAGIFSSTIYQIGDRVVRGMKALQLNKPKTLALDDWVMLDEEKEKKSMNKKKSYI